MIEQALNSSYLVFLRALQISSWVLALPLRAVASVTTWIRVKRYSPEKVQCPACGFRGDSGTNWKSCRVNFVETLSAEMGAIQHICFRCGCDKFHSKLVYPADKWFPKREVNKVKEAMQRSVL